MKNKTIIFVASFVLCFLVGKSFGQVVPQGVSIEDVLGSGSPQTMEFILQNGEDRKIFSPNTLAARNCEGGYENCNEKFYIVKNVITYRCRTNGVSCLFKLQFVIGDYLERTDNTKNIESWNISSERIHTGSPQLSQPSTRSTAVDVATNGFVSSYIVTPVDNLAAAIASTGVWQWYRNLSGIMQALLAFCILIFLMLGAASSGR